jgi:hypothetical protein
MGRGGGHGGGNGAGLIGAMVYFTLVFLTGTFMGIVKFSVYLYEQYRQSKKTKPATEESEAPDDTPEEYLEWQESGAQAIKSLFGGTITSARKFVDSAPCNPCAFASESEYITALIKTVQETKAKGKKNGQKKP